MVRSSGKRLVEYDALGRRVWILGHRCHHGATGSVVVTAACISLMLSPITQARLRGCPRAMLALVAAGAALMFHDRRDRSVWFARDPAPRALEA